jgi:hypothetical protein
MERTHAGRLYSVAAVVVAFFAAAWAGGEQVRQTIPAELHTIVGEADLVESYRLDLWTPASYMRGKPHAERRRRLGVMADYPIVEVGPVLDSTQSQFLKIALLKSGHHVFEEQTEGLFGPEMGFRFIRTGQDTATVIFDLHGLVWATITRSGEHFVSDFAVIAPEIRSFAMELFPSDSVGVRGYPGTKVLPWREYEPGKELRQ